MLGYSIFAEYKRIIGGKLMYWTMIFDILNKQEEYANCLQAVDGFFNGAINSHMEFLNKVTYFSSEQELSFEEIIRKTRKSFREEPPKFVQGDMIKCVFFVDCSNENEMVNLIYYCLANDKLNGKSILCVRADNQRKITANIKDLLSNLEFTEKIGECYALEHQRYHKVNFNKMRIIRRFSPIFYIGEDEKTAEYWHQSVQSFLLKLYRRISIGASGYEYTKDYFLPHICPMALKKRYPKEVIVNSKDSDVRLMNIFSECFCTKENENIGFVQKRYEIWKSKELFELVKDMPLLAMYIFCISDYFLKNEDTDSMEQIEQEIFDARDMADGLLQILENVYHSENRRGYFCFRVHNDSEGRSGAYLKTQYHNYMEERTGAGISVNYMEIKVVDFSHCTIPNQFFHSFQVRMECANQEEKGIYQQILGQASNLKVSDFFENSSFWHEYNGISENIVHHYGLQIFESLVSCYEGYFRVRSQRDYLIQQDREFYSSIKNDRAASRSAGIPGTQYDILMPFRAKKEMQNISLNVNINYTNCLLRKYSVCETIDFTSNYCTAMFQEVRGENQELHYQEIKERTIQKLAVKLKESIMQNTGENLILHFSAEKIALTMIEMFCKAVMLYIAQKPRDQNCYIMITECSQSHFIEITRMMALFYDKQGVNQLMKGTQVFMSGQKEGEEFLISGVNLGEAIGSTEKLAFARCIHPDCLKILKKMLKNHKMGTAPNEVVSIVPFDMIKYGSVEQTLFERSLLNVLNQDVQSEKFGCKLEKLHVRVGSKIHVRSFYEAELLFHNNYYTSRFAYWLFNELNNNNDLDLNKPFTLVGYENYSEMLLSELCNMFEQMDIHTEYLIYEQKSVGKFRGLGSFARYKDHQFVIIVPINSTMTTHIKTSGFLVKTIREALKTEKYSAYEDFQLYKVLNYGFILISDLDENPYWEKSRTEENTIISKIDKSRMKFYVEVKAEWAHPLKCKACFPEETYTEELPLVETNKESVVPMQAIGIKKQGDRLKRQVYNGLDEETERLQELSKFLVYDHVERNGNHFNYYFSTEKLWDFPDIRKNVQIWLEGQKSLFPKEERKVYDIIVAPLHFSNTAFVEEVNGYLFRNAALVLHFAAEKEFRMNVKTKYSSVQQLYDNLCLDDEESVINFHYVDDTIISGHTFLRMRSLIRSLIDVKTTRKVTINIFKSIVLLLNRMSKSSIKNYIEDTKYFMAYFNLNISSMRVNSDACVLCKKYNEWNKLAEQASLNEVYGYWKQKSRKIECKSIERLEWKKEKNSVKRQARAKQYMIASHKAKNLMDVLCGSVDKMVLRQEIVDHLFPVDSEENFEELVAMLKVLGRPFLTFRKEEKEAVFELMLIMLNILIQDAEPVGQENLYCILEQLWNNTANRTKIITMLLNRLAELESNYIIRKRSMNRIMEYCMNHIGDERERKAFVDNYLNRVKQLVGQSNDFAKGLFLEYLLLYDEEYQDNFAEKEIVSLAGKDSFTAFKRKAYLENTKLADYGIEYLADCFANGMECTEDNLKEMLNENYYFDNFIQYLSFHKMVKVDDGGKIIEFSSASDVKKLEGMVKFQLLYQKIFQEWKTPGMEFREEKESLEELKNKFTEMLGYLKAASGAIDGEIIVPYKTKKGQADKYIALELGESAEIRRMENKEQYVLEFMKKNDSFEGDTYTICNWQNKQKWILLKFYDGISGGRDDIPIIYMLFPFNTTEEKEILNALKNILLFRNKIWKILNLSGSTLLQNWTDSLFYKQQMLKSRAVGHTEIEFLVKQFQELVEWICSQTYQEKEEQEKCFYKKYFDLIVNSMIGYMNSQVLGDKGKYLMSLSDMNLMQFWEGEKECFEAACTIWNLKIEFKNQEELMEQKLRKGTEQPDKIPDPDMLRTLFLAVFQNAKKHGVSTEEGYKIITISLKDNNLCIENCVNEKMKEKIEKEVMPEAYRSGEGISQAVIFDTCQSWYQNVHYNELFAIRSEEKNGNREWYYVVKLPIIERKGGK